MLDARCRECSAGFRYPSRRGRAPGFCSDACRKAAERRRVAADPDLKWPAPLSASIDHVIPLSRGGDHLYVNVQLAHLRCNASKGARVDVRIGA